MKPQFQIQTPDCIRCGKPLDFFLATQRCHCGNCGLDFYDLTILLSRLVAAAETWARAQDYSRNCLHDTWHWEEGTEEYRDAVTESTKALIAEVAAGDALRAALKELKEVQSAQPE